MDIEKVRSEFEAAIGPELREKESKFALSKAYDADQSYTFLATKWAWKAWQIQQQRIAELEKDAARAAELEALINSPELHDFSKGVVLEAAHQRERWGTEHDGGKSAADWFWLIGYLAQKAMMSQLAGDTDKALHHAITTAAAMANWHAAMLGKTNMRPGIAPPANDA